MHGQRDLLDWQDEDIKKRECRKEARRRDESTVLDGCFEGEWREKNRWREVEYLFSRLGIHDSLLRVFCLSTLED
jgi:hypothetical protein